MSDATAEHNLDDLKTGFIRLEAKVDLALGTTQAQIGEHGRNIGALERDHDLLDRRVRELENNSGGGFARLTEVERAVHALTTRRDPQWPAIVSTITGAITLLLIVAGLLYLGPGAS